MELNLNLITLIVITVIMAFVYGLIRFAKKNSETGEAWNWQKFAPTAIYSVILGFIMAYTGVVNLENLSSFQSLFDGTWVAYMSLFAFILYVWENVVMGFLVSKLNSKVEFYPKGATIDPLHKMDQETRHWLVSDQKPPIPGAVYRSVDEAEAKGTYRYAIQAGAWIYLVEFGIVTGAKHYFFKFWFGTSEVTWKPITVDCLENIRKTGRFPDYDKLY